MMSLNAFSQIATDSSKIQLTKPIARLVIKDLIQYDGLTLQVKTMEDLLAETNNKLATQTNLVVNLQSQNRNLEAVIKELNLKYDTQAQLTKDFETALKRQKRQSAIYKVTSTVGAAAILLLLVK